MKKYFIAIVVLLTIAVGGWLGFSYWERGALPWNNPDFIEVSIEELSLDNRGVKISGVALYKPKVYQTAKIKTGCNGYAGEETIYIFPLIEDISSKRIKVMVRSKNPPPNDQVEKAFVTIQGIAYPPGKFPGSFNSDIRNKWKSKGYFLEKDLILIEEIDSQ